MSDYFVYIFPVSFNMSTMKPATNEQKTHNSTISPRQVLKKDSMRSFISCQISCHASLRISLRVGLFIGGSTASHCPLIYN